MSKKASQLEKSEKKRSLPVRERSISPRRRFTKKGDLELTSKGGAKEGRPRGRRGGERGMIIFGQREIYLRKKGKGGGKFGDCQT